MKRMKLAALLAGMVALSGCGTEVFNRPCPMVTTFPPALLARAADEIEGRPAISQVMDGVAVERAFNRAICA